jgi:cytidylate kinase
MAPHAFWPGQGRGKESKMVVITMSRQMGTPCAQIAERLCTELHLTPFDKKLMMRVAMESGLSETDIIDYTEDQYKLRGFVDALFRRTRPVTEVVSSEGITEAAFEQQRRTLDEETAVRFERSTINAACERGDVLIIGRGGQVILEDKANVLHVRLTAPFAARVGVVQAEQGITAGQAWRLVAERDRVKRQYLRTLHNADVEDPTLYHLVLNTHKLGVDACVALIKEAAAQVGTGPCAPATC